MKLYELIALYEYLSKFLDKELTARASFSIARFFALSEKNYSLYTEKRNELIYKYGEKENGELKETDGAYHVPPEQLEAFRKELNDLGNLEVEEPKLELYYSDLESLNLTPRDFTILMPYIKE